MKRIIIWIVVVFILTTALTMQLESAHDGIDKFGFPLTFFDNFSGKCHDCYKNFGFKFTNFLIDVGLVTMVVVLIRWAIRKLRK